MSVFTINQRYVRTLHYHISFKSYGRLSYSSRL